MKTLLLAAALAVLPNLTIKHVKEVQVFYSVSDEGTGVWWDQFVADDGSTCRHRWEANAEYKDRWVECRWSEPAKPAKPVRAKAEAEPGRE